MFCVKALLGTLELFLLLISRRLRIGRGGTSSLVLQNLMQRRLRHFGKRLLTLGFMEGKSWMRALWIPKIPMC